MSVTRTPVNNDNDPDPLDWMEWFYRDLEQHLRSRRLYEQALEIANRFKDRTKANVERLGDKDNTGSYVLSFDDGDDEGLEIAGQVVKFVKSEKYRKTKGGLNFEKAKELLTATQWDQVTSHVITIEVPGFAPVAEIVAAVKETLKDAGITEGIAIDPEEVLVEDKVVNLNYFDGPDQISDEMLTDMKDPDEYATRLIVNKKK